MKNSPMHVMSFCGLTAAILLAGCQRNISGAWLASDQSSVVWLQVVRTPDNHLTGQLASSVLKPDGSIERDSVQVTGAVDGENVTLSANRFLGLETVTLAGTLHGNTLTLTGGQSIPVTFKRSSLSDYQAQETALNARSQSIAHAKAVAQKQQRVFQAQANFVAQTDALIDKMTRFDSAADVHLGRFPGAEKGYEAITARIEAIVARERQLARNPNASVARGQLSVAASQVSLQTDQMHNQGELLESSLEGNIKPLADQAAAFEKECGAVAANSRNVTPAEAQNITSACSRLSSAIPTFRQRYNAMAQGLAHLEQVYQREQYTQQGLIQESERLE